MHQSVIIYTREYELSAENICTAVETHSEKEDQMSFPWKNLFTWKMKWPAEEFYDLLDRFTFDFGKILAYTIFTSRFKWTSVEPIRM